MLSMHTRIHVPLEETEIFLQPDDEVARRRIADLQERARQAGRSMLVEKTPRHIRSMAMMRRVVPGARFILMVRDGRDVTTSIGVRSAGNYQAGLRRWISDNLLVRAELGKPDVHLLRYEDLVADPPAALRSVCRFLGVGYQPQMLEYHKREHLWFGRRELRDNPTGVGPEHEDLRNWQVNQPIFDGRGRWKNALPNEFAAQFEAGTPAELMRLFGYAAS